MTDTPEVEEIVRFLRRFSDLMSTGHNADHLLRAANLVETLIKRARDADELLHEEQTRSENNLHLLKSTEINCANLEKELGEVKAKLAEQQSKLDEAIVNAAPEAQRLLDRAEQAIAQLPAIETELPEARARLATFGDSHALVPISTLRHAEALFAALAREAADVVSQAMCEVGASTLERAILESAAQQLPNGTSRHAA
jgi:DNA repair exonuclease SbcCD ATPase subunit